MADTVAHICGYFGPDAGRSKKLKSARGCLKRMAFCQEQGQKQRGDAPNHAWYYWFDEFGVAFRELEKRWPRAYVRYLAEEEDKLAGRIITLDPPGET